MKKKLKSKMNKSSRLLNVLVIGLFLTAVVAIYFGRGTELNTPAGSVKVEAAQTSKVTTKPLNANSINISVGPASPIINGDGNNVSSKNVSPNIDNAARR